MITIMIIIMIVVVVIIMMITKDPTRVQPFLSKVFEAMSKVTFTPDNEIIEMISPENEKVNFPDIVVLVISYYIYIYIYSIIRYLIANI